MCYIFPIMLKRLVIFAVLTFGFCGAWSQVPGNGGKQEKKAQEQQKTANPPKPVIATETQDGANNQKQAHEYPPEYPWRELYAPANIPNWLLVLVAGVAGWLAYRTLTAIKKQAEIMETQATESRKSGEQTFAILKEQTDNLLISAKAATVTAMAAKESAEAANSQIQFMKDKERARLSVSISADEFEVGVDDFDAIIVKVANDGLTSALNVIASGGAFGEPGENLPFMGQLQTLNLPGVLRSDQEPAAVEVVFVSRHDLREFTGELPYYFHASGLIEYQDVFGEIHKTPFRYRLKVLAARTSPDSKRVKIRTLLGWRKCGSPEENHAT